MKNNQCNLCGGEKFNLIYPDVHGWKIQACERCFLVQVIPRPSGKEVADLYKEDWDNFAPYLSQIEIHRRYFKEKVREVGKRKNLLDVGCALGVLISEANKRGIKAQGLDISADAVEYCQKQGLKARQGTLHEVIFAEKFAVITAFEVIEHERDPKEMVKKVYELLDEGGLAVFTTPNFGSWWRKLMGRFWPGFGHPEHLYFFTTQTLEKLFKKAGFAEVVIRRDSGRPYPLSFLFQRGADYFPVMKWLLEPLTKVFEKSKLINPINPWADLIIWAKKH